MNLFEAKREGYIQALKDLHYDGLLSLEEFKKREQEQMAKNYISPHVDSNKDYNSIFGGHASGKTTLLGSSDQRPSLASFDLRADPSGSVTSSFNLSPSATELSLKNKTDAKATSTDIDEVNKLTEKVKATNLEAVQGGSQIPMPVGAIIPQFKITLVGDGGVGKTAWVNRLKYGTFEKKYEATIGLSVVPLVLETSHGPIKVDIWDTAGQENFGALRDGYYIGSQGLVIMFDLTSRSTFQNVPKWYRNVIRVQNDLPIALVGNKCDAPNRQVQPKSITVPHKTDLQYYEISVKSCFNIDQPILHLLRVLMRYNSRQGLMLGLCRNWRKCIKKCGMKVSQEVVDAIQPSEAM